MKLSRKRLSRKRLSRKKKESKQNVTKTCFIHDNGGRPFRVDIVSNKSTKKFKSVSVYKYFYDEDEDKDYYETTPLLVIKNPYQVFEGNSYQNAMTEFSGGFGPHCDGNAVLVRTSKDLEYIFIGIEIISFKTKEPILYFLSPVGNNDVPYTYAISNTTLYLLSENKILDIDITNSLTKKFINGTDEPYDYFYEFSKSELFPDPKSSRPLLFKKIQERVW